MIKADFKDMNRAINNMQRTFPNVAQAIMMEFGGGAVKEAQTNIVHNTPNNVVIGKTPVDKFKLVTTFRVIPLSLSKVLFSSGGISGVDYAFYVDQGTSRFPGRFFMRGAVMREFSNLDSIANKAATSWLRTIASK